MPPLTQSLCSPQSTAGKPNTTLLADSSARAAASCLRDIAPSCAPRRRKPPVDQNAEVYLVGGGIASMAAAAFMIGDGDIAGRQITILEEPDVLGGSLDGSGSAQNGYVVRGGGRMLESKYLCTFDLFASIPALDSVRLPDDIVFAVEYSIRSAQAGVYDLFGLQRDPPPVYKGAYDPRVLLKAFRALHDIAA